MTAPKMMVPIICPHDSPSHTSCMHADGRSPLRETIATVTHNCRLLTELLSEMQPRRVTSTTFASYFFAIKRTYRSHPCQLP